MKNSFNLFLFVVSWLCCASLCSAQSIKSRPGSGESINIKFLIPEKGLKLPCVKIEINKKTIWAGIDTGLTDLCVISEDAAKRVGIYDKSEKARIPINGINKDIQISKNQSLLVYDAPSMEISNISINIISRKLMAIPETELPDGEKIECLINFGNLYRQFRVQLDYIDNVMRIIQFETDMDFSKALRMPYEFNTYSYIKIKNREDKEFKVAIDTGSQLNTLPLEFDKEAYSKGEGVHYALPGRTKDGKKAKTDFIIDGFTFNSVECVFSKVEKFFPVCIGHEFLKDKVVTLDLKAREAYIEWVR